MGLSALNGQLFNPDYLEAMENRKKEQAEKMKEFNERFSIANKNNLKNQIKTELKSGNTSDLVDLTNKTDVDEAAKKFNELDKGDQNKLIGNLLNDAYEALKEQFNKMKDNSTNSGFTLGQQENRGLDTTKNPNYDPTTKMKEIGDAVRNVGKPGSGISIGSLISNNDTKDSNVGTAGADTNATIVGQEVTDFQTKHMRKFNFNNRAFSR